MMDSDFSTDGLTYFLTQIAMRKMLQHCTLSVSQDSNGNFAYATIIAAELERQLYQWRSYLPETLSFTAHGPSTHRPPHNSAQSDFLRAQFYAYKSTVYWPAAYQATVDYASDMDGNLIPHCRQFFDSYVHFMTSAVAAVRTCKPNAWTLYARCAVLREPSVLAN